MARRINTKFLAISAGVVITLAGGAFLAQKFLVKQNPERFFIEGKSLLAERRFKDAVKAFAKASQIDPKNPQYYFWLGTTYWEQRAEDPDTGRKAFAAFNRAIEADPKFMEGLQRLLSLYQDDLSGRPRVDQDYLGSLQGLRRTAQRILDITPDDANADSTMHIASIQAWTKGLETDAVKIDEDIKRLVELSRKDTKNVQYPYYVAQAKLYRARQALLFGDPKQSAGIVEDASKSFDEVLKTEDKNALMISSAAQVQRQAQQLSSPEIAKRYEFRANELYEQARAVAQPSDPQYVQIIAGWADMAVRTGRADEAEKQLRELLDARPDDLMVCNALAEVLSRFPTRIDEAVDLLDHQLASGKGSVIERKRQEPFLHSRLCDLRLRLLDNTQDPKKRKELIDKIDASYQKLSGRETDSLAVRFIKGRLLLAKGEFVEAKTVLTRAMADAEQAGQGRDMQMVWALAQVSLKTQQTGDAKRFLAELLNKAPTFGPARKQLIELLLTEGDRPGARDQLDQLKKFSPEDLDLPAVEILCMDQTKDQDKIREIYDKLLEGTPRQKLAKADLAGKIGRSDDLLRLTTSILKDDPTDIYAVRMTVAYWMQQDKKDEAIKVVDAGLKSKPEDQALKILHDQLTGNFDPAQMQAERRKAIEAVADPYDREMQLAQLEQQDSNWDKSLEHLQAANKLKPDKVDAIAGIFQIYLIQKKWDLADPLLQKLVELNGDQAGGLLYRHRMAMARGDVRSSLALGQELTRKLPDFSQSWLAFAQSLQADGQLEEAVAKYVLAIDKQSNNDTAYRAVIQCLYQLNRPSEAFRQLKTARTIFRNDPGFREMEIRHHLQFGDPGEAIPLLMENLTRRPDLQQSWLQMTGGLIRQAQWNTAKGDSKTSDAALAKALELLQKASEKWPDEPKLAGQLASIYSIIGKRPEAEASLKKFADRPIFKDKPDGLLMLADFYVRTGQLTEAEATLRNALGQTKDEVTIQIRLADVLSAGGKADDALKVLQMHADNAAIRRKRAEILIGANRLDEAEASLLVDRDKNTNDLETLNLLATVYSQTKRLDQATACYNQMLSASEGDLRALFGRAILNLRRTPPNLDAALKDLLLVRLGNPQYAQAHSALSDIYRMNGELENSVKEMESALDLEPANKSIRLQLLNLYVNSAPPRWNDAERILREAHNMPQFKQDIDILQSESRMWLTRRDYQKAADAIGLAMQAEPNNPTVITNFLNLLLMTQNYQRVVDETGKLLEKNKNIWWVYQFRGIARSGLKDKSGALSEFVTALNLASDSHDEEAQSSLVRSIASEVGADAALQLILPKAQGNNRWLLVAAMLYMNKGDSTSALQMVENALADSGKLSPLELQQTLRVSGSVYISATPNPLYEKAKETYKRLLDIVPDDLSALNNMACLLGEMMTPSQPIEALKYSQRAFDSIQKAGRFDRLVYDTHGWTLVMAGKTSEGIDILTKVVDREPFPEAHYHLARAYLISKFPEEAQRQLLAANDRIKRLRQERQMVDPALQIKIDQALKEAQQQVEEGKKQAKSP